jgi:ubiquinol-cytochrome c reductase cytochrome c subunit
VPPLGVIGAAVLLGLTLAPRSSAGPLQTRGAVPTQGPQGGNDPRVIFLRDCATCHAADATGTVHGPSLIGVGRAAVDYWVSTGRMPLLAGIDRPPKSRAQLPPPGQVLPDTFAPDRRRPPLYPPDVIAAIDDYVAGLTGPGPEIPQVNGQSGDLGRGGELFQEQCAACHAWGGDGGALLHREAPSLHRATPVQIAEAIRIGPGNMPAFGPAALNDADLRNVVAYVTYLDHPKDRGGNPLWHLGPVAEGGVAWLVGMVVLLLVVRWIGERG